MKRLIRGKGILLVILALLCAGVCFVHRIGFSFADGYKRQEYMRARDTADSGPTPTPYERVSAKELPKKYTAEEHDTEMRATRLPTIRIDGRMEDAWDVCEVYELKNPVYGVEGASAQFRSFCDKDRLYLCITVIDDTPMTNGEVPTRCDSVEVYLNEDGTKPERYHVGDSHYIFLRNGTATERSGADLRLVNYAVTETGTGYIVEVSIAWSVPKEDRGDTFGLDIRVNDSHSAGFRDYIIQWSDTSMKTHEDLSRVGTMAIR